MRLFILSVLSIICVYLSLLIAQEKIIRSRSNEISKNRANLEHYYESIITNAIKKYYDNNSFYVNVRFIKEEKPVQKYASQDSNNSLDVMNEQIAELPGLPVLPEELRIEEGISGVLLSGYKNSLNYGDLKITILVDTTFTIRDVSFLMKYITMVANINEENSDDRIEIKRSSFPQKAKYSAFSSILPQQNIKEIKNTDTAGTENEREDGDFLSQNLLYIIIVIIGLMLFVIIVLFFLNMNGKKQKDTSNEKNDGIDKILSEISALKSQKEDTSVKPDAEEDEIKRLSFQVIYRCIGNPKLTSSVFSSWMENDTEEGVSKVAKIIACTDEKVLDVVKGFLIKEHEEAIRLILPKIENIDNKEKIELIQQFKKDLQNINASSKDLEEDVDLFQFTRQLNASQLLHLIKDEKAGIQALLIAQVKPETAVELLLKLDQPNRQNIMVNMGNIGNIPLKTYKDIAARMSRKALQVVNMKYIEADGVDNILEIIPALPIQEQTACVNDITSKDLNLAKKVRRFYVGFHELNTLPAVTLGQILKDFDHDVLATSLIQAPEELVSYLLKLFPERMAQMITSTMETKYSATSEEIDNARKKLVQHIIKELKYTGGRQV